MKTIPLIIGEIQKQFLDMENKILLLDDLGKKYGETHVYYNLKTPAEAIKLLCINHPEFAKDLATSHEQGIFYEVKQVDLDLELSDLFLPLGSHDLVIVPVITGSGNIGKALLGVALIGVTGGLGAAGFGGALFGNTGLTGLAAITAKVGSAIGVSLVLQGVTGLLSPQPTLSSGMDSEGAFTNFTSGPASLMSGAEGVQTYAYSGATNSSGLGKTIPVIYGQVLAGSLLIGAKIVPKTTQETETDYFRKPSDNTFTLNGDKITHSLSDAGGLTAKKIKGRIKVKKGRKYFNKKSKTLNFKDGEQSLTTSALGGTVRGEKSGKFKTKRFGIVFKISGLIDRVGNNDTVFIDGFITYQVIIKESSSDDVVGQHQMTIQGLMKKGQSVQYLVLLPFVKVAEKDNYKIFVKVIDHSVDRDSCTFRVMEIGMGLK